MKASELKQIIKESVKEIFREEIREILLESLKSRNSILENTHVVSTSTVTPQEIKQKTPPPLTENIRNKYHNVLLETFNDSFHRSSPTNESSFIPNPGASLGGGDLGDGEVGMEQISNLLKG